MKLSLCLEMLFTDRPFSERLAVASRLGYRAIEFWDFRDKELPALADAASRLGLTVAAMSGNRQHALIDPDARAELINEMLPEKWPERFGDLYTFDSREADTGRRDRGEHTEERKQQ